MIIKPDRINSRMVELACGTNNLPIQSWHIAANLNAMMEFGYCSKCGWCPEGCKREGCRNKDNYEEKRS